MERFYRNGRQRFATKVTLVFFLLLGSVFATGCKKTDDLDDDDTVAEQVVVNPDYVAIDWERANLETADDSAGTYTITFDGEEMPGIRAGSIIAIDRDTVVNYRYVVSVEWNGNRVNLTTVEAYLTDIFYDSGFTLATSPEAKKGGKGRKGKVIYAEAAYVTGEDGKYHMVRLNGGGKASTEFTHNLWQSPTFNYDGEVLYESNNMKIWMERMNMSMSIDMEMYMNFGGRTELEVVGDAISRYRSRALRVEAAFVGKFETEQEIRCKVTGQCAWSPDYDLWKHNLFRPIPIRFLVGGVPIVLTLRCDLFRQVEVTASGEMEFYTGVEDRAEGRVGFEWEQSGRMTPVSSFSNDFEFTPPTVEGRGTVQAKVWAFPRVSVMLYDVLGPSVDFMPYLSARVSGGFREQMLGTSNDYCAWSLDCNTGLDLRCGLSARFFGYEVGNWSTNRWNFIDINLYHSPKRVEHVSGEGRVGESRTISFAVYDQNNLLGRESVTPLPQLVKFEARGGLSSEYGIARGGVVSVDWTATENDVLYAKLYDIEGNVMSMASVGSAGGGEPGGGGLTGGEWIDLGLPSGLLWRAYNLGATSPEGYGNYYAWGETSPKSVYTWETYIYGEVNLYKYNTNVSYGTVDNLTTLEAMDDAATAALGSGARIPTKAEWQELLDNTTSVWTTVNNVNGRKLTGTNGNSLFLPAAGYLSGTELYYAGENGSCWSSSLDESVPHRAWSMLFDSGGRYGINYNRYCGQPVRAVRSRN
ncbi:MAG: hypothetical protein J5711_00980 [Bacteroidales bacterium]|nr:hypothetical protein [Bacteroidales bacterium]